MSDLPTQHSIKVTFDDHELARLDEIRPSGMSRPAFIRSLLREPQPSDVASREEALSILSGLARDGRVAAAIALERALRDEAPMSDELDEILGSK